MKILIAMNSFKGTLSSEEAGCAVREGVLRVFPDADIIEKKLADGGEGTINALLEEDMRVVKTDAHDPLGRMIKATYLLKNNTAIMESASTIGLYLLKKQERSPEMVSTYGLGEMILDAVSQGCREFIIGIGGTATNDGGAGMLRALGFRFLDEDGRELAPCCRELGRLAMIDTSSVHPLLKECTFRIACDVNNPLCGETGASAVYGPQKGADPAMVQRMDEALAHYAEIVRETFETADPQYPGSGAAGGLGFAFRSFLKGELIPGADLILQRSGIPEALEEADLMITGEGRLDKQTLMGKGPGAAARMAAEKGVPVIAVCGRVDAPVYTDLFRAVYGTDTEGLTEEEIMNRDRAYARLADTAEEALLEYRQETE